MDYGIKDKVVFLAGGSKGMGRDVAHMLAAEGCKVGIVARTQSNIDETVASITEQGGTAMGIQADVTSKEGIHKALDQLRSTYGDPLIVIGQAIHNVPGDFDDLNNDQDYLDSFNAYTMSQVHLLRAVLPAMREAGWGRYVHIGSATAKEPEGAIHHVLANTTRPSTTGLLKTVADENAGYGITVNTIAPGWIATENAKNYLKNNVGLETEEQRFEWMRNSARVPAGRMGEPKEIASTVTYLCSDLAGFITGNWIEVDGGHHRSMF